MTDAYRTTFFTENLSSGAETMRFFVEQFGYTLPYAWLMLNAGLHTEVETLARRSVEEQPFNHLWWQMLAIARANRGDAQGSLVASRARDTALP